MTSWPCDSAAGRSNTGSAPARLHAISLGDDLVDPESPRSLSDSDLEIYFRPLAGHAGLPVPETKAWVLGFEVDFHFPSLCLMVETDGLRCL